MGHLEETWGGTKPNPGFEKNRAHFFMHDFFRDPIPWSPGQVYHPVGNPRVIKLPEWRAENKRIFYLLILGSSFFVIVNSSCI